MSGEKMETVDIRSVKQEELVDITTVHVDENLTGTERKKEFIRQVKNPYCYRVGNMIVKSRYTKGVTMNERFQELVMSV